jgi:hypothetical protein
VVTLSFVTLGGGCTCFAWCFLHHSPDALCRPEYIDWGTNDAERRLRYPSLVNACCMIWARTIHRSDVCSQARAHRPLTQQSLMLFISYVSRLGSVLHTSGKSHYVRWHKWRVPREDQTSRIQGSRMILDVRFASLKQKVWGGFIFCAYLR